MEDPGRGGHRPGCCGWLWPRGRLGGPLKQHAPCSRVAGQGRWPRGLSAASARAGAQGRRGGSQAKGACPLPVTGDGARHSLSGCSVGGQGTAARSRLSPTHSRSPGPRAPPALWRALTPPPVPPVQVDQRVFRDLVSEKLPRLHTHFEQHRVDYTLITFNWFLVVFVDSVVSDILFKIWDSFLYEGPKVGAPWAAVWPRHQWGGGAGIPGTCDGDRGPERP